MATAAISGSSGIQFQIPQHHPMEDLFPKELLDAVGGPEAMAKFEVKHYRSTSSIMSESYDLDENGKKIPNFPKEPTIQRGIDENRRSFLVIFVPGKYALTYHPSSNCSQTADYIDLNKWWIGTGEGSAKAFTFYSQELELLTALVRQIKSGENCRATRREIYHY
jgi:hypothetical protein